MAARIFRRTLRATEQTDVPSTTAKLRSEAASAGLSETDVDSLVSQVDEFLDPLVRRGKELSAVGSHVHVERKIEGAGYSIAVVFGVGERPSLLSRLVNVLKGR